jgi:general stress protein YciG
MAGNDKPERGFASMSEEERRDIARKGGESAAG